MKIKTNTIKKSMSYISKVKPNQFMEITNYYEIHADNDALVITATDGTNYLVTVDEEGAQEKEEKIIVKAEQFRKLVDKVTSEFMTLEVCEDYLEVRANGKYKVEIYAEEEYPTFDLNADKMLEINTSQLIHAINVAKNAKCKLEDEKILFNYLVRNCKLIGANTNKVSCSVVDNFNTELLISNSMALLLNTLDSDTTTVTLDNTGKIMFEGENIRIMGHIVEGAEDYPDIFALLNDEYSYQIELDTQTMLQALTRLELFLGAYDGGFIDIEFTRSGLQLSTPNNSVEVVNYITPMKSDLEINYLINLTFIKDLVRSMSTPTFLLYYGDDSTIKLQSGSDEYIVALVGEED